MPSLSTDLHLPPLATTIAFPPAEPWQWALAAFLAHAEHSIFSAPAAMLATSQPNGATAPPVPPRAMQAAVGSLSHPAIAATPLLCAKPS